MSQDWESKLMTFEEYARKKHDPVYIFDVEFGSKKVTYFGAEHNHNPESPMFDRIEAEFKKADPQIVFVEGMYFSQGGKQKAIEKYKNTDRESVIKNHGESVYVFRLAADAGIEVDSPESSLSDEITFLLQQEFSKEQIFCFYGYRQINGLHRLADKSKFNEELTRYISVFQRDSQWKDFDYSPEHLEKIGKSVWGEVRGDVMINDGYRTTPVPPEDKKLFTLINQINQEVTHFRDCNVVRRVVDALKTHDRLFIIFGSTHAVMQEPALRYLAESYDK
ncbi:MAG: hypothetical protein A3A98_01065 [Candidatus Staskawiczbacteria bacterium RIFCSPLOWO2_01_FULL_40_39]|uniref:Uncharacterized protein n=1 Tax=Candidatus Staskawiczbacteria bacterium RIFCSPHIGHO2_01_FULL_39_25 TaxID=1802202 RepID=A0A1G2HMV4_9BACT|nr:MAG: hypothetical protein A2730_01065 [Candidatus Staskawiczbacteria bacterium RIFCSPHIGHO2_01_FULL_39_25]OGZ73320.1 MAG: hypothetical protein A3A98_01065 [Candidatus Staskawiczbacteria bacterium RIFCSPLOWO2_01_FULL_40_39]OGZ75057.1 MAG: hypothetical protein A3I87_01230 [Candidatus Staskawiczbacteria bacterium RIFCSPLOWO2_02_FULL_39_8]